MYDPSLTLRAAKKRSVSPKMAMSNGCLHEIVCALRSLQTKVLAPLPDFASLVRPPPDASRGGG